MRTRHPENPNLTLTDENSYRGLPLLTGVGPYIVEYLGAIKKTVDSALREYPRTFALRVDLRYPSHLGDRMEDVNHSAVISKFVASLKAKLLHDFRFKVKRGKRVHRCNLRYVWVKERSGQKGWHYHIVLFLNKDAYYALGRMDSTEGTMIARIRSAWASALGIPLDDLSGGVYIPNNAKYFPVASDKGRDSQYERLFIRLSYFAKSETKVFGGAGRSFGCSRG